MVYCLLVTVETHNSHVNCSIQAPDISLDNLSVINNKNLENGVLKEQKKKPVSIMKIMSSKQINASHLAEAAFAENLDEVEVLEAPPLHLSVLPACRGRGRGGRGGGGGGGRGGGVLGSLLVE